MELLTITPTARELGVCTDTVRQYVREGVLPAYRNYRGWRVFRPEDVERLRMERQKLQPDKQSEGKARGSSEEAGRK